MFTENYTLKATVLTRLQNWSGLSSIWRHVLKQMISIVIAALLVLAVLWVLPVDALPSRLNTQNSNNAVSSSFTTIPYAGFLTDSNGNPITQSQILRFSIWDQSSNGNQLWPPSGSEIFTNVPFRDGYFSVMLGSTSGYAISPDIFDDSQNFYLQIQVGNEILTPRQPIGSVPLTSKSGDIPQGTATHTATVHFGPNEGTPSTTNATTFENIPGYEVMLTTDGGPILLMFQANIRNSADYPAVAAAIDFTMDGVSVSGAPNGITRIINATSLTELATVFWLVPSANPGSHTFRVQWKTTIGGEAQINQTAFTTQFSAIEFRR